MKKKSEKYSQDKLCILERFLEFLSSLCRKLAYNHGHNILQIAVNLQYLQIMFSYHKYHKYHKTLIARRKLDFALALACALYLRLRILGNLEKGIKILLNREPGVQHFRKTSFRQVFIVINRKLQLFVHISFISLVRFSGFFK